MAHYKDLNNDILKIIHEINSNENIRRLLYFNTQDALSRPDLPPNNLIMTKIFPVWKRVDIEDEVSSFCFIYFDEVKNASKDNIYFRDIKVYIDVITHIDSLLVNSGSRLYSLMEEVDEEINDTFINGLKSLASLKFSFSSPISVNEKFVGYRQCYHYTGSVIRCQGN